jgi:hypothetical protein
MKVSHDNINEANSCSGIKVSRDNTHEAIGYSGIRVPRKISKRIMDQESKSGGKSPIKIDW